MGRENEFVETFIDPFGNNHAVNRVLYKQIDFRLTKDLPQLELRTPPRGCRFFQRFDEDFELFHVY
jgi:hypothetical protein